ncbi:glycoside hydrolase family 131 protein [Dothidotthia symphoricarpi CBS 119687]|uniref:Glycoside hydrolase family 131 protein n=1 Tax=Dothidotthia symphoricarpi CBS 119687 TaxID=1392245 RepID=A0A6A6A835_9PLEO|nr:glycoside hydrolase family 131 protein [Dothidotthia symphoricarpi CBS 119687]KAF2126968.1 glycoside hydrolase family 131 protein [Dothidotthia symphoricarpi CBS 119687]
MHGTTLFSLLAAASSTLAAPSVLPRAPQCPIVFDGRIPVNTTPSTFDTLGLYNKDYVKGNNLTWSDILLFPNTASRFDGANYTAVEVTISDKSIFQKQNGFRRAGLQFMNDAADGPGGKGVKTLHWSVKQDGARKLNLTHEYLNAWHETADYSANQIQFQAGSLIGKSNADKNSFKILDRAGKQLWSTKMEMKKWQNFAVKLDYVNNQTTIYYSADARVLQKVAGPLAVDLSGQGQFQLGILKKPMGTDDVVNSGYQSPNLNEGQIYGGVFLEDSANGCISL